MKLHNKKTGGIFDVAFHSSYKDGKITIGVEVDADPKYPKCNFSDYESLEEFCENWEDYIPKEPLIKDEKIRKVVRAWAENVYTMYSSEKIIFYRDKYFHTFHIDVNKGDVRSTYDIAELDLFFNPVGLEDGKEYTITELCGEKEA